MKRFASTRSEVLASQLCAGRAQCKVGSIEEDGIRYGFTTQALIASTIATAPTIVTSQSIAMRSGRGRPAVNLWMGPLMASRAARSRPDAPQPALLPAPADDPPVEALEAGGQDGQPLLRCQLLDDGLRQLATLRGESDHAVIRLGAVDR